MKRTTSRIVNTDKEPSLVISNQSPNTSLLLFYLILEALVLDIILDSNHPLYKYLLDIGKVKVSFINQNPDSLNILWVYPIVCNMILYPVKHLVVLCYKKIYDSTNTINKLFVPQKWYYKNTVGMYNNINSNVMYNISLNATDKSFGKYFNINKNIQKIIPGLGDLVIQGRQGNYIWFTSLLKKCKNSLLSIGSNNSLISIGYNNLINNLYSTAVKRYTQYLNNILRVLVKSQLIILNSSRNNINILSNNDILLKSNNILYISSLELRTLSKSILLLSSESTSIKSKKIYLNLGSQQAILGNKLVKVLEDIISAVSRIQVSTVTGPSSVPMNVLLFENIKIQLNNILSKSIYLK